MTDSADGHVCDGGPRNKAERLAVAGAVAPSLRRNAERAQARRVARVDAGGNVVGYSTLADVQRSMLERAKIEIAVADGRTPERYVCSRCNLIRRFRRGQNREVKICEDCRVVTCVSCGADLHARAAYLRTASKGASRCVDCYRARGGCGRLGCVDCGKLLSKSASSPSHPSRLAGIPPRCQKCHGAANRDEMKRRASLSNARKRAQTHCKRGHEFSPENIYLVKGCRTCKVCRDIRNKARRPANDLRS